MRSLLPFALLLPTSAFAQASTELTEILWWHGNGGETAPGSSFATAMVNKGGTVVEHDDAIATTWDSLSLTDYRIVVLGRPTVPFTTDQIQDLQDYLDDDHGILVIAGDDLSAGGQNHIDTVNALTDELTIPPINGVGANAELSMFLTPSSINPTDATTDCGTVPITANSPFWTTLAGTANGIVTMGNIETDGVGPTILSAATFNINDTVITARLAARQGRVLLTSDFDLFSNQTCGVAGRTALFENLWEYWCDRDEDHVISAYCGLFDCDDFDGLGVATNTFQDLDGDGFGSQVGDCGPDAVTVSGDCDDENPDVNTDADEVCDEIDNDCDTRIDEDDDDLVDGVAYYADLDGDGHGRPSTDPPIECTSPGDDWSTSDQDCDDGDDEISPDAVDICGNNEDDNCDGQIDETCTTPEPTDTPNPTGGPDDPGGCNCSSVGATTGWLGLGLVLTAARRRRRRA